MSTDFAIGRRVKVGHLGSGPSRKTGTIVGLFCGRTKRWAVRIVGFKGHSCDGICPNDDGWWLYEFEMSLYELTAEERKIEDFMTEVNAYVSRELS